MLGKLLHKLHKDIQDLADEKGNYYIHSNKDNKKFFPMGDKRFEIRDKARKAAKLVKNYRKEIRIYIPSLPIYNLIVSENVQKNHRNNSIPIDYSSYLDFSSIKYISLDIVDFCYEINAAFFEVLSKKSYTDTQNQIIDRYLKTCESVKDYPYYYILLETIASKLYTDFSLEYRYDILESVAEILSSPKEIKYRKESSLQSLYNPVYISLNRLSYLGLLDYYVVCPNTDFNRDRYSWEITFKTDKCIKDQLLILFLTIDILRQNSNVSIRVSKDKMKDFDTTKLILDINVKPEHKEVVSNPNTSIV